MSDVESKLRNAVVKLATDRIFSADLDTGLSELTICEFLEYYSGQTATGKIKYIGCCSAEVTMTAEYIDGRDDDGEPIIRSTSQKLITSAPLYMESFVDTDPVIPTQCTHFSPIKMGVYADTKGIGSDKQILICVMENPEDKHLPQEYVASFNVNITGVYDILPTSSFGDNTNIWFYGNYYDFQDELPLPSSIIPDGKTLHDFSHKTEAISIKALRLNSFRPHESDCA